MAMSRLQQAAMMVAALNDDEFDLVEMFVKRVTLGADQYGHLDVATDRRDMDAELREEVVDALVYALSRSLQLKPGRRRVTKPRLLGMRHEQAGPLSLEFRRGVGRFIGNAVTDGLDRDDVTRIAAEAAYRFAAPILFGKDDDEQKE